MATADYMDSKDENLLISIMKQDIERGARLLISKYKEPIYWHIRRLVVSHDDAQDAAQRRSSAYSVPSGSSKETARSRLGFTKLPPTRHYASWSGNAKSKYQ